MQNYLILHLILIVAYLYFLGYSIQRIIKHWKDGKERVITSSGRLIVKIACTVACSVLQFAHIADYMPSKYSYQIFVIRTLYFSICGATWLVSSTLVYFDYSRRLSSQWIGQRSFWILGVLSNILLLTFNFVTEYYDFDGKSLFSFDIVQITAYVVTIILCILLSFYAIFMPNDFSIISPDLFKKLKKSTKLFEDTTTEHNEEDIIIKTSIIGNKIKEVKGIRIISYTISVSHNSSSNQISRTLEDFEALDSSLRKKFPRSEYPNLAFPEFVIENIRKESIENRAKILQVYLSELCVQEFMTSDLLNFLQIEGHTRDLLAFRNSTGIDEKINFSEEVIRSESNISPYFSPNSLVQQIDLAKQADQIQWLVAVSIPSYRIEEDTVDYFIKSVIKPLNIDKIQPRNYKEICDVHNILKKSVGPAKILNFPSKNYSKSLKKKEKDAIEQRKKQVEYYFSCILNDPAYLSQEVLEFIGCDSSPQDLYSLIPKFSYKLKEEAEWQDEIGDDSSHFISFSFTISRSKADSFTSSFSPNPKFEVEWEISKRYREFDTIHKKLSIRHSSPLLKQYLMLTNQSSKDSKEVLRSLPQLPSKTMSHLSTLSEKNERKKQLFNYLDQLLQNPGVTCSYFFREFIEDKEID